MAWWQCRDAPKNGRISVMDCQGGGPSRQSGAAAFFQRQGIAAQWISFSPSGGLTGHRGGSAQGSTLPLRPSSACLRTVWRACPCLVPVSYLSRTCLLPPMWIAIHMGGTRQVPDRYQTGAWEARRSRAFVAPWRQGRRQALRKSGVAQGPQHQLVNFTAAPSGAGPIRDSGRWTDDL